MAMLTTFLNKTSLLIGLCYLAADEFLLVTAQTTLPGTFFHVITNGKVTGEPTGTSQWAKSLLHCVAKCGEVPGCSVVTYESAGKQCYLYNWTNVTIIEETGTRQSWVDKRTLMLNARRQGEAEMTLADAFQLCVTLGGALIHIDTIYDARDHDDPYDKCRCGWISDDSQRFVISTPDSSCNHSRGTAGIKYCSPKLPTVPDAYCDFK